MIALRGGVPQFAIGAAGGSTIPTTILQTLIGHVDFGKTLAQVQILGGGRVQSIAEPHRLYGGSAFVVRPGG